MAMDFGKLNFAVGFNRTSAFPLDANSYFESYSEAMTAAAGAAEVGSSDSAYYIGQLIIVKDSTEGVGLYQITAAKTLVKFGQASSAEELAKKVSALENRCLTIEGKLILASSTSDGLMSKEDFEKLAGITDDNYKNKIDSVKVNGTEITPVDKVVNLSLEAAGQTVKLQDLGGSFTGVTGLEGSLGYTSTSVLSTGSYTPSGSVSGTVTPEGSIAVTLKNNSVNSIKTAGSQATFKEGDFTPASITYADSDEFVKEGIKATVGEGDDAETLIFSDVTSKGKASVISAFSGGSKAKDAFTSNTLPTFEAKTVAVDSASFTGASSDITASFSGTAGTVSVSGNYDKANLGTVAAKTAKINVSVDDIDVIIPASSVSQK